MKQNTNGVKAIFNGKPDLNRLAKVLNDVFKNIKTDGQQESEQKAG